MNAATKLLQICALTLILQACTSYDPVPKSKCSTVVRHAKKVLGTLAPARKEMMADCKSASDTDRGCIMAATSAGAVSQCF